MGKKLGNSLTLKAAIMGTVFIFVLILTQYLLFAKILGGSGKGGLTGDEIRLYKEALTSASQSFSDEVDRLKIISSMLSSRIESAYKSSKIKEVQGYFNKLSKEVPGLENVFLFNKFGRLLAFTPYKDSNHWNVYDFARYYGSLKSEMSKNKAMAFTYYYLLDDKAVASGLKSSQVIQPPFWNLEDYNKLAIGTDLGHSVLKMSPSARVRTNENGGVAQSRTPFFVVASPSYLSGRYFGMSGFMVSMEWMNQKVSGYLPSEMMTCFLVSKDGYLVWYPEKNGSGRMVKSDALIAQMIKVAGNDGASGVLKDKNVLVFYRNVGGLIFAGILNKLLGASGSSMAGSVLKPVLPIMIIYFVFELIFAVLLFLMLYNKIFSSLGYMVRKYGKDVKGVDGDNEIEDLETILSSKQAAGGLLSSRIVSRYLIEDTGKRLDELTEGGRQVEGAAVYINIRNAMDVLQDSAELLNQYVTRLYQLAEEKHGYVSQSSFHSFMVYFGVPFYDPEFARRTTEFLSGVLVMTTEFNKDRSTDVRVAYSADAGLFNCGRFHFQNQEEVSIRSDIIQNLPKYEGMARDSVAMMGETLYKTNFVPAKIVREEITMKVKGSSEPQKVYLLKS